MNRAAGLLLLAAGLGVIAAATLLPTHGDAGSLAASSAWWCFTGNPIWLADAISNVALFLPLGVALALTGVRTSRALLVGSALSLGIESLQWMGMPPGRTPALADWITNSAGALLGARVAWDHACLLRPSRRTASRLLAIWTIMVAAVFWTGRWAMSPAVPTAGATSPVTPSTLPFTPGHGWFAAFADSATVNGVPIPHGGTGPVIAAMARTDTVRVAVTVRGRDPRVGLVPIVFVHVPGDTMAHLLLGQRGTSAVVRMALNAGRAGLMTPELALPAVFAPRARAPETPVRLHAVATNGTLTLTARERGGIEHSAALGLTPLLGWTLVQSVVRVDSAAGPLMTVLWVLLWLVPWGYWAARAAGVAQTT